MDRVGIALLFPAEDIVLPSLWEAVAGPGPVHWSVRDEDDRFVEFTPEMDRVWRWKDELPAKDLACAGKHLRGRGALISLEALPALYALTGRSGKADDFHDRDDLSPLERDVAEFVLQEGPVSTREVRRAFGAEGRKAADRLEKMLILTKAGVAEQDRGWAAALVDVLPRRYRQHLRRLPKPAAARQRLTRCVLASAKELSAADVAGALGWRRREAGDALEGLAAHGLATVGTQEGITLYRAPR